MTTEVVTTAPISADEARRLTDAIRSALETTWQLVQQAYTTRAWVALGYASWEMYCESEFRDLAIPKGQRHEVVGALRSAGMSTRAISSATGLSKGTVGRELAGAPFGAPHAVTGADGKTYAAQRPVPASPVAWIEDMRKLMGVPDDEWERLMGLAEKDQTFDPEWCRGVAQIPADEFESVMGDLEKPSDYTDQQGLVYLAVAALRLRLERRIGQLLVAEGGNRQ